MSYPKIVELMVDGIPCKAKVSRYKKHKGTMSRFAPDPETYLGWTDLSYTLLDRKGYPAPWLEDLADRKGLWEDLEGEICEEMEDLLQGEWEDYMERKREERLCSQ